MRLVVRAVAALLLVTLLGITVVATRIVLQAGEDERRTSDVVVVLGAAQFDGVPQPYLEARLEHALDLYREGVAPRIVTVGGARPGDRFTEASAAARWLGEKGVPAEDVAEVPVGGNTLASLSAAAELMRERGWVSAVVVTDPWHTLRAVEMLEQQGRVAYGSPTRTGPSNDGVEAAAPYVAREAGAYLLWLWQRVTT